MTDAEIIAKFVKDVQGGVYFPKGQWQFSDQQWDDFLAAASTYFGKRTFSQDAVVKEMKKRNMSPDDWPQWSSKEKHMFEMVHAAMPFRSGDLPDW